MRAPTILAVVFLVAVAVEGLPRNKKCGRDYRLGKSDYDGKSSNEGADYGSRVGGSNRKSGKGFAKDSNVRNSNRESYAEDSNYAKKESSQKSASYNKNSGSQRSEIIYDGKSSNEGADYGSRVGGSNHKSGKGFAKDSNVRNSNRESYAEDSNYAKKESSQKSASYNKNTGSQRSEIIYDGKSSNEGADYGSRVGGSNRKSGKGFAKDSNVRDSNRESYAEDSNYAKKESSQKSASYSSSSQSSTTSYKSEFSGNELAYQESDRGSRAPIS